METEFELNWRVGKGTAAFIAKIALKFASTITLTAKGIAANTKDPTDIMRLGPPDSKINGRFIGAGLRAGSKVRLAVRGPDAPEALKEFWQLFHAGPRFDRCPHQRCPDTPMLVDCTPTLIQYNCTWSGSHDWQIARKQYDVPPLYLSTVKGPCPWPGRERLTDRERILIEAPTVMDVLLADDVKGDLDVALGFGEYLMEDWYKLRGPDNLFCCRGQWSTHKRMLRTCPQYAKAVGWPSERPQNEAIIESWRWIGN